MAADLAPLREKARAHQRELDEPRYLRVVADAGLVAGRGTADGVVYHTLRHTFASWLVMRGVDLYNVAQLLGNSLKMIEQTYAHLSPDYKRQAIDRLSGAVTIPLPGEAA